MARILGLDDVSSALKSSLAASLRAGDEAVVLPGAHRSSESGALKNVAIKLGGADGELSADIFSPNWFSGVSAVQVPKEVAESLVSDPKNRKAALQRLVAAIPSETDSSDIQVGPGLDGDEHDRDLASWVAGFDGSGCCVGLYSAQQSCAPETNTAGMNRPHSTYFLVCKAGGGYAAQTFHSRLAASLSSGLSLDDCLKSETSPGAQALRRVGQAAQRNRARILEIAARELGFEIDTIGDNAASSDSPSRCAITQLNVHTNALREIQDSQGRSVWQYSAGCVDAALSQGVISATNVHQGFLLFTSENSFKINLRNNAFNTLPFSSERILSNREVVMVAAAAHKRAIRAAEPTAAHPDFEWIAQRFGWKSNSGDINIEPCPLWGSYESEHFCSSWGRELGVSNCYMSQLKPEIVALAAVEPTKLRAAIRHIRT